MGQERPKKLHDLLAVQAFYVSLIEAHLGHPVLAPAEVKQEPDSQEQLSSLMRSLKLWLDLLDMAITPPMVREALKRVPTPDTAHALLRYFEGKASLRTSDRDKTDCVVTHLFRKAGAWQRPELDTPYYHLTQAASIFEKELRSALSETAFDPVPEAHLQHLREFEFFHQEMEEFRYFDQITDSAIVQRVRELKQSLEKSFYHPQVLATLAVWNDVFGRKFGELFHDATRQIKTFAENVKSEGGSILSRVEGDITVKHLSEIETQQILSAEYQDAQDQFRRVSKYKKAVDQRRGGRKQAAAPAASAPAPQAGGAPVSAPPSSRAEAAVAARSSAPSAGPAKPQADVLAIAPSAAVQNAVHEGKIHSTRETIKHHVRNADSKLANLVPIKRGNLTLSPAEAEAFRADYSGEKSFRADYANILMLLVCYHARMSIELDDYNQKSNSAYLWKPHADALRYLVNTLERLGMEADQIKKLALQRGLQDKVTAVDASLEKARKYARTVSQTLQAADHTFTS